MAEGAACPQRVWPTPGCAYVARERLVLGATTIEPGQPFDYARHGMVALQAEQWWAAAILDVAPEPSAIPVPPVVVAPVPKPATPTQPSKHQHHRR